MQMNECERLHDGFRRFSQASGGFPISQDRRRTGEDSKMMNPLSSERPSAGAVMAFDGQTEITFSRRKIPV